MRTHALACTFMLCTTLILACGGGNAPAKDTTAKSGDDPKTLTEQKRGFMSGCTKKVPDAPDYCECAWELFARNFTKEEMSQADGLDDDKYQKKLQSFKEEVQVSCGSKMPEGSIKASFLKACSSGGKLPGDYCECKYGEFRKKLAASELTDEEIVKTPRFVDARKAAVKACGAKVPEGPAQADFLKSCISAGGGKEFCECGWKTARKTWSVGEVMEGTMGQKDLLEKVRPACASLQKPAPPGP
jgi:hypothetical protein